MKEIEERRSIRHYKEKEVEPELIEKLLESARLAPSGSNTQPWNFIIVRNRDTIEKLAYVTHKQKSVSYTHLTLPTIYSV